MDLTLSPDLDARLCYGIVFLCAVVSGRIQVLKRFVALKIPTSMIWLVPNTWLIFGIYLLTPLGLFWLMDRMSGLSDTSLFSALLVGLAYPAILAGGFGGLKSPAGLDGIVKPVSAFTDSVVDAVNRKLVRNEKRFEDYVVSRMLTVDKVFDELLQLVRSSAKEVPALDKQLTDLDAANIPDKTLLAEKKARTLYLYLSSMPDFVEVLTKNVKWIGNRWKSPIYQARVIAGLAVLLLAGVFGCGVWAWSQPNVALDYHVWRLGKPNNSAPDRDRASGRLGAFLQDTNLGPVTYQSITRALRAPGLPVERVDRFLQLALQARSRPYHDELLCRHLLEDLRVESVDARSRVHQALIFLAETRDTKEVRFREKEKELADWNPTTGDSVPKLEKRVDQWKAFFCPGAAAAK